VIETEFAFQMRADVPPQEIPYTHESIRDFVGAVLPSFEIVEHHFVDWTKVGGYVLAADNAIHGAWVHGEAVDDWQEINLERAEVTLSVGGEPVSHGRGDNVLGHPLAALAWLANELPKFELGLKEGDFITTGTATEVYKAQAGDELSADFGILGQVKLSFA
jgi:2-keto-4-pentenoate hydratase